MNSLLPAVNRYGNRFDATADESFQSLLPLIGRIDGPAIVQESWVGECDTYRDAVRLCWALRRIKGMTKAMLAAEAGLYPSHVSDYLNADDTRRSLPAEKVAAFEAVCGNCAISQWMARRAGLTVLEEVQARRAA